MGLTVSTYTPHYGGGLRELTPQHCGEGMAAGEELTPQHCGGDMAAGEGGSCSLYLQSGIRER